MSLFLHEQLYRSPAVMEQLRTTQITICGAGALGANLAEMLARSGVGTLTIIDRDRIEDHNLSTQPYTRSDIGAHKAKILANNLYRAVGVPVQAQIKELTQGNVGSLLKESQLVIDAFDNSPSRQWVKDHCDQRALPCLHTGLSADYAEVIWNERYRVPFATQDDVCDYPLARSLVILTVAVACEVAIQFVATREQPSYMITLKDLTITPFT